MKRFNSWLLNAAGLFLKAFEVRDCVLAQGGPAKMSSVSRSWKILKGLQQESMKEAMLFYFFYDIATNFGTPRDAVLFDGHLRCGSRSQSLFLSEKVSWGPPSRFILVDKSNLTLSKATSEAGSSASMDDIELSNITKCRILCFGNVDKGDPQK